jgi:hypothetical protein
MIERSGLAPQQSTTPLFLVFDSTIPSCETIPLGSPQPIRGCVGPRLLEYLGRLLQTPGHVTEAMFLNRNAESLAIDGTLGDDVKYIPSATITTRTHLKNTCDGILLEPQS